MSAPTMPEVLNPYLRDFLAAGGRAKPLNWDDPRYFDRPSSIYGIRHESVRRYAWAIPDQEAIAALVALGPIVEVGAGTGYWAGQIAMTGGDVLAYDIRPPRPNRKRPNQYGHDQTWHPVIYGGPTVARRYPDRALLLCWPPYSEDVASRSLASYRGSTLAYVGEGEGGCTGDDAFFAARDRDWELVREVKIPQWPGMNDYLAIYCRRSAAQRAAHENGTA